MVAPGGVESRDRSARPGFHQQGDAALRIFRRTGLPERHPGRHRHLPGRHVDPPRQ